MYATDFKNWIASLDRRLYALGIGLLLGLLAGGIGLLLAVAGPLVAAGVLIGVGAGLYVLTNVQIALYGVVALMALLPFGTLPFRIGFTPTLLDVAMGAFIAVYLVQWMTGSRRRLALTPVHICIGLYLAWLIISFVLGLRYAPPNSTTARQFAESLLSVGLVFVLVDVLRDAATLRRFVRLVLAVAVLQGTLALGLYAMNDAVAERTLVRLARIGYPNGGVIRYIEDNPALDERAIGTWVDPNALGGFLAVTATFLTAHAFGRVRLVRPRVLMFAGVAVIGLALYLTYSRAALLAFAGGVLCISLFAGYRRLLAALLLAAGLFLVLPQTQPYVERLADAFTAGDLATQMRLGEYGDSLELISRYPFTGVGFTGTPEIDLYTDVASMYLIMANQIGLFGVGVFLCAILAVLLYGYHALRRLPAQSSLRPTLIGAHAALLTAMAGGIADHYYFRLDFHASVTLFWLIVSVCVASARLALLEARMSSEAHPRESTVANPTPFL